LKGKGKV